MGRESKRPKIDLGGGGFGTGGVGGGGAMGVDFYRTLEVSRSASDDDIKKAYRKLVMKWHPDKNLANKERSESMFKLISQAYEVLSDPGKRKAYDLFGEAGIKGHSPQPQSPTSSAFRPEVSPNLKTPNSNSKTSGAAAAAAGGGGSTPRASPFGKGLFGDNIWGASKTPQAGTGAEPSPSPKKGPPNEHTLMCTLEELYTGSSRKMKINRSIIDSIGRPVSEVRMLLMDIKPGWKKGTRATFTGMGNQQHKDQLPSDLVFIIDEKPHPVFKREENDLIVTQKISLTEALLGYTMQITTLDGSRSLNKPIENVPSSTFELVMPGEGMPISKEPSKKGNLIIRFQITLPVDLTPEQKESLKKLLPP